MLLALREREFRKKKATFPFSLLLPRSAACWLAGLFRSSLRRVFVDYFHVGCGWKNCVKQGGELSLKYLEKA
jgi:hypothetical protein